MIFFCNLQILVNDMSKILIEPQNANIQNIYLFKSISSQEDKLLSPHDQHQLKTCSQQLQAERKCFFVDEFWKKSCV